MKCPKCNGKGYVYNALGSFNEDCGHCQGTGKVRVKGEPMTNEEWLRSATTEQLADVIADFYLLGYTHGHNQMDIASRTRWTEWLKQPHKE